MVAVATGLYFSFFPHSLHEFKVDIGGGLVIVYQLDMYQRWIAHVFFHYIDLFYMVVGEASERWIVNHFEDDDDFEGFGGAERSEAEHV